MLRLWLFIGQYKLNKHIYWKNDTEKCVFLHYIKVTYGHFNFKVTVKTIN
jgi:hypothetical protein